MSGAVNSCLHGYFKKKCAVLIRRFRSTDGAPSFGGGMPDSTFKSKPRGTPANQVGTRDTGSNADML